MTEQNSAETPNRIARKLLRDRKATEALALLQEILQTDDNDREAQELLGMAFFMTRQFPEARDAFEKFMRMDPTNATAYVNLGAIQNVLKDYMGAVKSLRKAIQRDKRSASAYYNMGIAQKAMKMNSMAIAAYREAIRLDPSMAEAYTNLGNIHVEMNNLTKAVRLLEDGVAHCPHSKKLVAVLEKAKRAKDGVRREDKPLGRLVDEKELLKKRIRTTPRLLDEAQRVHERETLHDLGKTIRRSTKPIVELLNGSLKHQLHLLDLAAAQNDARGEAPRAYDEMTMTLNELTRLRDVGRQAIGEIRDQLQKTDPGV